jgi:hypothetical protein
MGWGAFFPGLDWFGLAWFDLKSVVVLSWLLLGAP